MNEDQGVSMGQGTRLRNWANHREVGNQAKVLDGLIWGGELGQNS